jgi:hypothetical protein
MPEPSSHHSSADPKTIRVFISYAHDPDAQGHRDTVQRLCALLRRHGIDAWLDLYDTHRRQDWPLWMERQVEQADYVLVVASAAYKSRADGVLESGRGRGVQHEATILRELVYAHRKKWLAKILPVILPGNSVDDIPTFLQPYSSSHYIVNELTLQGIDDLYRVITAQPAYPSTPLGRMVVRPPRSAASKEASASAEDDDRPINQGSAGAIGRLMRYGRTHDEAVIRDEVWRLLTAGDLGLGEHDLDQLPDRRHRTYRINVDLGRTVIHIIRDLRNSNALRTAIQRLAADIDASTAESGRRYVGILTDGIEWQLYHRMNEETEIVNPALSSSNNADLLPWLEGVLATGHQLSPTPNEIIHKLGSTSPEYMLDTAELMTIYQRYRDFPAVKVKRDLWAKLLTTATGTNFTDDDSLFIDHTLLVAMAEIIAHAVVGIAPADLSAAEIMSGRMFSEAGVRGVVEADFFDWIAEVPDGDAFVNGLAQRLTRFVWNDVNHDVMKVLYESIISPQARHRLGEYYTPDWLAELILDQCVTHPLGQHVHDASCGSGTFVFHAVRRYLKAAEAAGITDTETMQGLTRRVTGVDVHPVAVTLARVTYLLAIGLDRLRARSRPSFTVPIYLADSLRWGIESNLLSYEGLSIPIDQNHRSFVSPPEVALDRKDEERLRFPDRIIADSQLFDRLVAEFAESATSRDPGSSMPSVKAIFRRLSIDRSDWPVLEKTFQTMCRLHDQGRDHIWGYYVRNLAYPAWLAQPANRVDVLVGNPPWLAFRYMTDDQQSSFKAMCVARNMWAGASVATHQDLSALFITRCIELYLKPGGAFGYVMPLATLTRRQYKGFRSGTYPIESAPFKISFSSPWDLHGIKPSFFPVPACTVFGHRVPNTSRERSLDQVPKILSGRFDTTNSSLKDALQYLTTLSGESISRSTSKESPYGTQFTAGANVFPRFLFLIDFDSTNPLGSGANRRAVRSHRSPREKAPWKFLKSLHGTVEQEFIRPLYLSDVVMPFRVLSTLQAVIPWDGGRLLDGLQEDLDLYPGLAKWWRKAENLWITNRSSDRLSLIEQLDYRQKLSRQFPTSKFRVAYTASGMYPASAIVFDQTAIIEHQLYWAAVHSLEEARFLTAIFNSNTLMMAVRPLQGRGEHNPRHFDKYIFQLPIPLYNPVDAAHQWLVALAERAEGIAATVELANTRFEGQRRQIRDALVADGVAADIDAIVKDLLA